MYLLLNKLKVCFESLCSEIKGVLHHAWISLEGQKSTRHELGLAIKAEAERTLFSRASGSAVCLPGLATRMTCMFIYTLCDFIAVEQIHL